MNCILHGEVNETARIGNDLVVCGVKNGTEIHVVEDPEDGKQYQVKGICGQTLTDGHNSFYHAIDNSSGMGDCIQLTAFFQYLKRKYDGAKITHRITGMRSDCAQIDPRKYYPDGLVEFTEHDLGKYKAKIPGWNMAAYNNWMWAGFLRDRGIYTDIKQKQYQAPSYDVVYCPVLFPNYNKERTHNIRLVESLYRRIMLKYPNSVMVLDAAKVVNGLTQLQELAKQPNVILSKNIEDTFKYILNSKVYIGGDTGLTHFAGAAKHRDMVLLYANHPLTDGERIGAKSRQQWYAQTYNEPELISPKYLYSALPCCPEENFTVLDLETCDVEQIMQAVEKRNG